MPALGLALFPPEARICFSVPGAALAPLPPEEAIHARDMTAGRLLQFSYGRACAREALVALGGPPAAIPVGKNREPLWPPGIVGSISHTQHLVSAVAGRTADFAGLGLDIETGEPLENDVLRAVCTARELDVIAAARSSLESTKLIFSIKESIFKCVWPRIGRFIDFLEVEVSLDPGPRKFGATATQGGDLGDLVAGLSGRYEPFADGVLTGAWIPAGAVCFNAADSLPRRGPRRRSGAQRRSGPA